MNNREKNIESFPKIKAITLPIKQIRIIELKYFFPCFNSSFVYFARRLPIGIPRIRIKIANEKIDKIDMKS